MVRSRALPLIAAALLSGGLLVAAPLAPASAATCLPGTPLCLPGGDITPTSPVGITGTPKVGETLTATPATWDPEPDSVSYQWTRGGQAIADATGTTYVVQAADVAQEIRVVETATALLSSGTSTSDPVTGLQGDAIANTKAPVLSGKPQVGAKLTVTPGTWTGTPTPTFSYRWFRAVDGAVDPIAADTTTYTVRQADLGGVIIVVVTARRAGYKDGTARSNVITLTSSPTTTTAQLLRGGERPLFKVVVKAGRNVEPTGRVTLYANGKKLSGAGLDAGQNGTVTIQVRNPLLPGRYRFVAKFVGSEAVQSSNSKPVTVVVR
ncbi:Ig-like domain repeat protein [Nocardioides sp.]|uniref:Ig-like domain repeat protein n=1 Tax=Nocardioides sp. TaxID=35761 RepID=UPI003517751E